MRVRLCTWVPHRLSKLVKEVRNAVSKIPDLTLSSCPDCDLMLVVGTDRDILTAVQELGETPPILTVAPPGYIGYLTQIVWDELVSSLEKISRGEFHRRTVARIGASIDGVKELRAINEVAAFPHRSATVMEYTLRVNSEVLWRDVADGVIVATPLGSTAYALSAGGPVVLLDAEVLVVVPVNSLEPSRRPLVVPQHARILIGDIASRYSVEVIADGIKRERVEEYVELRRCGEVVFAEIGSSAAAMVKKKLGIYQELQNMPPSAKFVYRMLEIEGPMDVKELAIKTLLPERTIRYALSLLLERGLVERVADLRDPRRYIYRVVIRRSTRLSS